MKNKDTTIECKQITSLQRKKTFVRNLNGRPNADCVRFTQEYSHQAGQSILSLSSSSTRCEGLLNAQAEKSAAGMGPCALLKYRGRLEWRRTRNLQRLQIRDDDYLPSAPAVCASDWQRGVLVTPRAAPERIGERALRFAFVCLPAPHSNSCAVAEETEALDGLYSWLGK